jgi:UDP-glucose 4-epimerase
MKTMAQKALVTGGAGFIGSHVADELIDRGLDVVVLDDLSGGFRENIPEKAEFVEGSIVDTQLIHDLFTEHKFSYVYHMAAYAAEGLSHFIKKFNYENNVIGSINLINASVNHAVKCFVFTSSIAVYGKNQLPMTEEMVPVPEDPYGIAKLAVEQDLRASHEMFGLNYVVFRPHNVYGERQNIGDRYRNVVGIFMNQLMQGQPMTIFGDGQQSRAFSYIQDVAPSIAGSPFNQFALNKVFNIGAETPHTVNELATIVAKAMGGKEDITYLDARNEVVHAFSTHKKLEEVFGEAPKVSLVDGVHRMALWAKKVGAKRGKTFEGVEILKNMPKSWSAELAAGDPGRH